MPTKNFADTRKESGCCGYPEYRQPVPDPAHRIE